MFRILLIFAFLLTSCSGNLWIQEKELVEPVTYSLPWQTWQVGLTPDKKPYLSRFVKRGDELFSQGDFDQALQNYFLAENEVKSIKEKEGLVLRITSVELYKHNSDAALDRLSGFYKKEGVPVNHVSSDACTLFAYIYGSKVNFPQSLAWFSQAIDNSQDNYSKEIAQKGIINLLSRIEDSEFSLLSGKWNQEENISEFFSEERSRRLQYGSVLIPFSTNPYFWEESTSFNIPQKTELQNVPKNRGDNVAILLPLTGKYGRFGQNVRRGMELAFSAKEEKVSYTIQDTSGNPRKAALLCEEIAKSNKYSVILGPLLFGTSQEVSECAKRNKISILSLTKKSDFQTGSGIHRLGITPESQIDSLVSAVKARTDIKKLGVIYPQSDSSVKYLEALKSRLAKEDMSLVFEYTYYEKPIPSFSDLLDEVELTKPEGILIIDDINIASRISTALGEKARKNITLIGTALWANTEDLKRSTHALQGSLFVSPFFINESTLTRKFISTYKSLYNSAPDILAAQGFDSATLVASALIESKNSKDFNQSLKAVKRYNGLTGLISINADGKLNRRFKVVEIREEGLFELKKKESEIFIYRGNDVVKKEEEQRK